jgi:hypothetical protein
VPGRKAPTASESKTPLVGETDRRDPDVPSASTRDPDADSLAPAAEANGAVAHLAACCAVEAAWCAAKNGTAAMTVCSVPEPLSEASVDRHTKHHARMEQVLNRLDTEDAQARIVAQLAAGYRPRSIALERPVSTELAASLIMQLAPALAVMSPEGAETIRRVAVDIARAAHMGANLSADMAEADQARLRKEHARALDGLRYVTDSTAERVALTVAMIRNCAKRLLQARRAAAKPPTREMAQAWASTDTDRERHIREGTEFASKAFSWRSTGANGWEAHDEPTEDVARSEREAIRLFREAFPTISSEAMADAEVLGVLTEMARPEAPDKNSVRGKAAWKGLREQNARRALARLPKVTPITADEQAQVCLPVLAHLGSLPRGEDRVRAVREAMQNGMEPRLAHYGVTPRNKAAPRPSTKKPPASTVLDPFDSARRPPHNSLDESAADIANHPRKAARRT